MRTCVEWMKRSAEKRGVIFHQKTYSWTIQTTEIRPMGQGFRWNSTVFKKNKIVSYFIMALQRQLDNALELAVRLENDINTLVDRIDQLQHEFDHTNVPGREREALREQEESIAQRRRLKAELKDVKSRRTGSRGGGRKTRRRR